VSNWDIAWANSVENGQDVAQPLGHLAAPFDLLKPLPFRLVEARVLDGYRDLVSKSVGQLCLLGRKMNVTNLKWYCNGYETLKMPIWGYNKHA